MPRTQKLGLRRVAVGGAIVALVVSLVWPARAGDVPEVAQAQAALLAAQGALAQIQQRVDRIQDAHARLRAAIGETQAGADKLNAEAARNRVLQAQLDTIKAKILKTRHDLGVEDVPVANLIERDRKLSTDLSGLAKRLEAYNAPCCATPSKTSAIPSEKLLTGMKPVGVLITNNRVVPFANEFFSARKAQTRSPSGEIVAVVVISRTSDGQLYGDSIKSDGSLTNLIKSTDKSSKYFQLQVTENSISTARLVAQYLRARGFTYAWDTAKDQDIIRRADSFQDNSSDRKIWGIRPN